MVRISSGQEEHFEQYSGSYAAIEAVQLLNYNAQTTWDNAQSAHQLTSWKRDASIVDIL